MPTNGRTRVLLGAALLGCGALLSYWPMSAQEAPPLPDPAPGGRAPADLQPMADDVPPIDPAEIPLADPPPGPADILPDPPAPVPISPSLRRKAVSLFEEIIEPEVEFKIALRRSKIIRMRQDITRISVADPNIVNFVPFGPREAELQGTEIGTTTVTIWLGGDDAEDAAPAVPNVPNLPGGNAREPEAGDGSQIISLLVTVTRDTGLENIRRLEYSELQAMINEMFPNSKIQLITIADKVLVRGEARDEQELVQILSIIRQAGNNTGAAGGGVGSFGGALGAEGPAASLFGDDAQIPSSSIINLLTVPGEKQVMLKVRIAELNRSATRNLGVNFDFTAGDITFASLLGGAGNLITTGTFDNGSFNLAIDAAISNGMGKILAEPNVIALSGRPATFLSGGQFAVPTVVGVGGAQASTTSFKNFGTQLVFTPTVLDKDRIRLDVAPSFSTLNGTAVQGIPGTNNRSVTTTVDMREGQVFAIAGLIQEQQAGQLATVPFFGDIPVVRQLFMRRAVTRDETELIILVSPELVHPIEPEDAPLLLPGMEVTEPDDFELFLCGQIEGRPNCHHRSTVWPLHKYRTQQYMKGCYDPNCPGCPTPPMRPIDYEAIHESEEHFVYGPHGFTE